MNLLLFCSPQQFGHIKKLAEELGLHRILAAMQILDSTYTKMQRSTQSRILMELALIRIANLDHFYQVSTLLEQLRTGTAAIPPQTVKSAQRMIAPPSPSSVRKIGLEEMTDDQARSVWFNAMDSIAGMLGSTAMQCKSIRLDKPNVFVATFDSKTSKDFCERGSAQLQGVLSQSIGETVKVRLEFDAPAEAALAESALPPSQANRERHLAAAENPLVLKIQETFGVTLHKVER